MKRHSSATPSCNNALSPELGPARLPSGLGWGLLGVIAFSLTVPLTRVAVAGLSPLFIASGRAVLAAVLATIALTITRSRLPSVTQWLRLYVVGGGVIIGFPLLTTYALTSTPASHAAMVIAGLPAATAVIAVVREGSHAPVVFWVAAASGAIAALLFASTQGDLGALDRADVLLFGAVLAAALGYAEGGLLARELGAWQTISWALVACAPLMVALTWVSVADQTPRASPVEWASFVYLGAVSMYLGFFAWYRGLAIGPMHQVSQVQLLQPVLTIAWAALLLREHLDATTVLGGLVVVACATWAVRVRPPGSATRASEGLAPAHPQGPSVRVVEHPIAGRCDGLPQQRELRLR